MNCTKPLIIVSLVSMLAACGAPNNGYYAADGTYVPPRDGAFSNDVKERRSYYDQTVQAKIHAPAPTYVYERRGYYDYYGNFIPVETNLGVPPAMFPPAGMCRVWFPDRPVTAQPRIESCADIRERAPAGTYVIYGG